MLVKRKIISTKYFSRSNPNKQKKHVEPKNKLTDVIRTRKNRFTKILNQNKNNIKGTWEILNSLIKNRTVNGIYPDSPANLDNENSNMNVRINHFNKHLVNIGPDLSAEIQILKSNQHKNLSTLDIPYTKTRRYKCQKSKPSTDCYDIDMPLVKKVKN